MAVHRKLRRTLTTEKSLEPPHPGLSGRLHGLVMMSFGFVHVMPWSSE